MKGGIYGSEMASSYQLYIGGGEIDDDVAGVLINQMFQFDQEDPQANWEVVINCPGGTTEAGTAMYEELVSYSNRGGGSHFITTIAAGQCSSMATLVSQAGDWRVTGKLTVWTFHEPTTGVFESNLTNIQDDMAMLRRWNDAADRQLLERSTLSFETYQSMIKGRNVFALGEQLLGWGFVDEVR